MNSLLHTQAFRTLPEISSSTHKASSALLHHCSEQAKRNPAFAGGFQRKITNLKE